MGDLPHLLHEDNAAVWLTPPASPSSEWTEAPPPAPTESTPTDAKNSLIPSDDKPISVKEFRRQKDRLAFYDSIEDAQKHLGMMKVKTQAHKNCCLMFAYLVVTEELKPKQQTKPCVAA